MTERTPYEGVLGIVRYNWPFYLGAAVTLILGSAGLWLPFPFWVAAACAILGALWFLFGSLLVSHWVYDRSSLYHWDWMKERLGQADISEALVCVAGFDEVSKGLAARFPDTRWQVVDHYDPKCMTEASIHRARKLHPPAQDSIKAAFDDWPELHADLVLAPMAIHEFRSIQERAAWFEQARKALRPGGRILVIEHVRDAANFFVFGPGFLHFHSFHAWRESWQQAKLELVHHSRLTPFLRVFILQ